MTPSLERGENEWLHPKPSGQFPAPGGAGQAGTSTCAEVALAPPLSQTAGPGAAQLQPWHPGNKVGKENQPAAPAETRRAGTLAGPAGGLSIRRILGHPHNTGGGRFPVPFLWAPWGRTPRGLVPRSPPRHGTKSETCGAASRTNVTTTAPVTSTGPASPQRPSHPQPPKETKIQMHRLILV